MAFALADGAAAATRANEADAAAVSAQTALATAQADLAASEEIIIQLRRLLTTQTNNAAASQAALANVQADLAASQN